MRIRFGPFTLDLDTRQLTRGQPRDPPHAQGVRPAGDARCWTARRSCRRPCCRNVSGRRPSSPRRTSRISSPRFARRSAISARAPTVHSDRARVRLRVLRRRRHAVGDRDLRARIGRRAGSSGTAGAFHSSLGEHVIGRDPDVEVRLDVSTVSRRHARLVVTAEGTVLEDFGSKNGTFRGGERVTSPVRLADGDAIRIGSLLVTFHVRDRCDVDGHADAVDASDSGRVRCHSRPAPGSVPTRSSAGWAPAAWARSTARAIRGSGATSRSS